MAGLRAAGCRGVPEQWLSRRLNGTWRGWRRRYHPFEERLQDARAMQTERVSVGPRRGSGARGCYGERRCSPMGSSLRAAVLAMRGRHSQSATASGSSTGPPWLDSSPTWRYGKSSRSGQPPQRRRPCKIRLVHGATRRWSVAPPVMASSGAVAGSRVVEVLAHEKVAALISPNLREIRAHD